MTLQTPQSESSATAIATVPQIVHLRNPMYLPPNVEVTVICSSPIKLALTADNTGILLAANLPATFHALDATWLSPTVALGPSFVEGWNKLPDELKVRILHFDLISHEPIRSNLESPSASIYKQLTKHLLSIPEIADLAREIFYTKNTFKLRTVYRSHSILRDYWTLPNPNVTQWIQRAEFNFLLAPLALFYLRRLSSGRNGFQNLRYLKVIVEVRLDLKENGISIALELREKCIRIACEGVTELDTEKDETSKDVQLELLKPLASRIFFGCSEKKRGVVADVDED